MSRKPRYVWAVWEWEGWDESTVRSVWSTEEAAKAEMERLIVNNMGQRHLYEVVRYEVDPAPDAPRREGGA